MADVDEELIDLHDVLLKLASLLKVDLEKLLGDLEVLVDFDKRSVR